MRERRQFLLLNIGHFLDHSFTLAFATVAALALDREWGLGCAQLLACSRTARRLARRQLEPTHRHRRRGLAAAAVILAAVLLLPDEILTRVRRARRGQRRPCGACAALDRA